MKLQTKQYIHMAFWTFGLFGGIVFIPLLEQTLPIIHGLAWCGIFILYARFWKQLRLPFFLWAFAVCSTVSGICDIFVFHDCVQMPEIYVYIPPLHEFIIDVVGAVLRLAGFIFWFAGSAQMIWRIERLSDIAPQP